MLVLASKLRGWANQVPARYKRPHGPAPHAGYKSHARRTTRPPEPLVLVIRSPEASYYHAATTAATTPLAPGLWGGGVEAEGATILMSELGGDSHARESRRACMAPAARGRGGSPRCWTHPCLTGRGSPSAATLPPTSSPVVTVSSMDESVRALDQNDHSFRRTALVAAAASHGAEFGLLRFESCHSGVCLLVRRRDVALRSLLGGTREVAGLRCGPGHSMRAPERTIERVSSSPILWRR